LAAESPWSFWEVLFYSFNFMVIFIVLSSIFLITGTVWVLNKVSPVWICPICAGVSGTWLWMLAGIFSGQLSITNYQLLTGILMGGSVVGIAYQLEKRLPAGRSPLLWKTIFIPFGFAAVYSLIFHRWIGFSILAVFLALLAIYFLAPDGAHFGDKKENKKVAEIEKKMKNCC